MDLFMSYTSNQNAYANKKVFYKKANTVCLMDQIGIESHSFLEY